MTGPKRGDLEEGGFLNAWAQKQELSGLAGKTRHLLFGVIEHFEGELVVVKSDQAGVACGLRFGDDDFVWDLHSEAPKCPPCQEIADADKPPTTDIPIEHTKREQTLVPA